MRKAEAGAKVAKAYEGCEEGEASGAASRDGSYAAAARDALVLVESSPPPHLTVGRGEVQRGEERSETDQVSA